MSEVSTASTTKTYLRISTDLFFACKPILVPFKLLLNDLLNNGFYGDVDIVTWPLLKLVHVDAVDSLTTGALD